MYGQHDWEGILISVLMRIVQIFIRSIAMIFWVFIAIIAMAAWIFIPLIIIYQIYFQLVGR
jgi:hypothetical protein